MTDLNKQPEPQITPDLMTPAVQLEETLGEVSPDRRLQCSSTFLLLSSAISAADAR